jgi:hypothetical protein
MYFGKQSVILYTKQIIKENINVLTFDPKQAQNAWPGREIQIYRNNKLATFNQVHTKDTSYNQTFLSKLYLEIQGKLLYKERNSDLIKLLHKNSEDAVKPL